MIIGCLTGNGKRPPLDGSYAFYAAGVTDPLPPDLRPDRAPDGERARSEKPGWTSCSSSVRSVLSTA